MTSCSSHSHSIALRLTVMVSVFVLLEFAPSLAGTLIHKDPKGFLGIPWGVPLKDRTELTEIDSVNIVRIFALKDGSPEVAGIPMESMKLYTFEGKYARAVFHYQGDHTHESLMNFLEDQFGKIDVAQGGMLRGLNQQYTWRGSETEITLNYHGFRKRGFLSAESRVLAPLFFHAFPDQAY